MSKELESLENIKNLFVGSPIDLSQQFEIIEKALKEYEGFQIVFKLSNRNEGKKVHDNLKALEIIKNHKLLNYVLKNEKCAKMYHLSQEDIDLLKVVLK